MRIMKMALLGQPNTGKSTLFNQLTGLNQHIGNWPGKTVEQKSGILNHNNIKIEIIDLPGIYSLTANSQEEKIARSFIVDEKPDAVIVVIDASQLERTMHILSEVKYLQVPVIAALNMADIAEKKGVSINADKMEKAIGMKAFSMVASKNRGVTQLKDYICKNGEIRKDFNPVLPEYPKEYKTQIDQLQYEISDNGFDKASLNWITLKCIEQDKEILKTIKDSKKQDRINEILKKLPDGLLITSDIHLNWVQNSIKESVVYKKEKNKNVYKFDKIATHPFMGPIVGLIIMIFTLIVAFAMGTPLAFGIIEVTPIITKNLAVMLTFAPDWVSAAVCSGVIPGIMFPLSLSVFMAGIYFAIAVLEDVGYMARLVFLNDKIMSIMGLHGKSFMPMCMSFVCNVSGVLGTRIIESNRQRLLTLIVSMFVPCIAIWGIIGFISAVFFGAGGIIIVILLLLSLVVFILMTSILLKKTVLKGERIRLIMELPPYHTPNWKTILKYTYTRSLTFIKRAGLFMLGVVIVLWFISYFPGKSINDSYLSYVGKFIEPVGSLMGMDWRLVTCLFVGFMSKEAVVASMAILFDLAGSGGISITDAMLKGVSFDPSTVGTFLSANITAHTAIAFMFALFFSIPCQATLAAIYSETQSAKWTFGIFGFFIFTSLFMGTLAYKLSYFFI